MTPTSNPFPDAIKLAEQRWDSLILTTEEPDSIEQQVFEQDCWIQKELYKKYRINEYDAITIMIEAAITRYQYENGFHEYGFHLNQQRAKNMLNRLRSINFGNTHADEFDKIAQKFGLNDH